MFVCSYAIYCKISVILKVLQKKICSFYKRFKWSALSMIISGIGPRDI